MNSLQIEHSFFNFLENVKTFYQEDHRFFHNVEHLMLGYNEIQSYVQWYVSNISKNSEDTSVCLEQIAAWAYHDSVYSIANAADNERLSALLAVEALRETDLDIKVVEHIILDTKLHYATGEQSKLILDIDMASLGYSYDRFLHYRKLVIEEYKSIYNERQLFDGVLSFIESTLKQDSIYHLDYFKRRYHTASRANLMRYREQLLATRTVF